MEKFKVALMAVHISIATHGNTDTGDLDLSPKEIETLAAALGVSVRDVELLLECERYH